MIESTNEQHETLQADTVPIRAMNPVTNTEYVLLRREVYDKIRRIVEDEDWAASAYRAAWKSSLGMDGTIRKRMPTTHATPALEVLVSQKKKQVRAAFRRTCFERDGYACVMCEFRSTPERAEEELDAHHITDRNLMPNGGYVEENGISLCADCHRKAEIFHSTGHPHEGFSVEDLYEAVGSSYEKALEASEGSS